MTIEEAYHERVATPSDINEHLCTLRLLAEGCSHITEFGVRTGNSTIAFLAGLGQYGDLFSYDINSPAFALPDHASAIWHFTQADTATLAYLPPTDLLFIDTLHTYDQVKAELRHGNRARKWLLFHDTVLFGNNGENNQRGIKQAIYEFMHENPHWAKFADCRHNNGLLILRKT